MNNEQSKEFEKKLMLCRWATQIRAITALLFIFVAVQAVGQAATGTLGGRVLPIDAPAFVMAQFGGALAATVLFRWLLPDDLARKAPDVLVPHSTTKHGGAVKTYIFACVHNAGRSQMAAAFFNLYAENGCRALSAGTMPADHVHPEVLRVMSEIGIDLSGAKPQKLSEALTKQADVLVTMGCGEACPFVLGLRILEWSIPDPKGQPLDVVRQIRDEIHEQVRALLRGDCADCCGKLTQV